MNPAVLFFILANAWWMTSAICFAIRPSSYVGLYMFCGWACIGIIIGLEFD